MVTIIVTRDDDVTDEFRFDDRLDRIRIGRRDDNDVVIPCRSVSARHAALLLDGLEARIEDLGSTNGTWLDGRRVDEAVLAHGVELRLGQCRLTFLRSAEPVEETLVDGLDSTQRLDEKDSREAVAEVEATADAHSEARAPVRTRLSTVRQLETAGVDADDDEPDLDNPDDDADDDLPESLGPYAMRLAQRQEAEATTTDETPRRRFDDPPSGDDDEMAERDDTSDEDRAAQDFDEWLEAGDTLVRHTLTSTDASDPSTDPLAHGLDGLESLLESEEDDAPEPSTSEATAGSAAIDIVNGAKAGQSMAIKKPVTTLGRPGVQIAAIMRRPDGYYLMHVESDTHVDQPSVNRRQVGDDPVPLENGDELQVAGVAVRFRLDRPEKVRSTDTDHHDHILS